jgi:chaperonin cofactor prefoldin
MTDEELRELVHRVDLRIERLDARFDGLEKRMATLEGRAESLERTMTTRFEGLGTRLNSKASNWVISL